MIGLPIILFRLKHKNNITRKNYICARINAIFWGTLALMLLMDIKNCILDIKISSAYIPKGPKYLTMSNSCPNNELYPHIATILLLHSSFANYFIFSLTQTIDRRT